MSPTRNIALAVMLAFPLAQLPTLAVAQPVYSGSSGSQSTTASAPRITGFDVEQVDRLEAGSDLQFRIWGTPSAQASLRIDGATRSLPLYETAPGLYEGLYTVSRKDSVTPGSLVTANLRVGNRVETALLDESLQRGWSSPASSQRGQAPDAPQIERFDAGHGRPGSSNQLSFTLRGTPGGTATVQVPGLQQRLRLDEQRRGEYSATYTVRPFDQIETGKPIVARLRVGDRVTTTTLNQAFDAAQLPRRNEDYCETCGTVVAINRVEVDGDGKYLGAVTGGLLGAVLGSQVGKGDGRTAAGIAGAVGGAVLGRQIERNVNKQDRFEVVVRLNAGTQQVVTYENPPQLTIGQRVRITDGSVIPDKG